jgi:hypothetical protein
LAWVRKDEGGREETMKSKGTGKQEQDWYKSRAEKKGGGKGKESLKGWAEGENKQR